MKSLYQSAVHVWQFELFVFFYRPIGRASSEMRLYWVNKSYQSEESLNIRARYFSGQKIYGDAILASIGYAWKSMDLFYEDVPLRTYYRSLFIVY